MKKLQTLSIKDWAESDRPREKLLEKGRQTLSNSELLAILIGSGSREETAVELCQKILLSVNNDLNKLGKLSTQNLIKFKGIGEAKAISIVAALELGRRRKSTLNEKKETLNSSQKVFLLMHKQFVDLPYEEFWLLTINRANKIINKYSISKGGLSSTVVDVRLIMKFALNDLASSIILLHNHPSGNLKPSNSDRLVTEKLKHAAKLFDITLLDHLIVTDDNYFSFADNGML